MAFPIKKSAAKKKGKKKAPAKKSPATFAASMSSAMDRPTAPPPFPPAKGKTPPAKEAY